MVTRASSKGAKPVPVNWCQLLQVYLHDPIDKALDIHQHEKRAALYASRALGQDVTLAQIKDVAALVDPLAAIAERIPMPTTGTNGERTVSVEDGRIEVRHPVSAQPAVLQGLALDEKAVAEAIGRIVEGLPNDPRVRFLALWRLLPERLEEVLARLPADTRIPDHTLIQYADIASGIWASQGACGGAYLSLSLGPVQKFIEAARSVRDLWSGSAILSWLTFKGIVPVLEILGPTALVYPALRGNPLMDLWLRACGGLENLVQSPSAASLRAPSIPNRFVALVPWGQDGIEARAMADTCAKAVQEAWKQLAADIHCNLSPKLAAIDPDWACRWQEQVDGFFEVRTATMPERDLNDEKLACLIGGKNSFGDVWPEAHKVRALADAIPAAERPSYNQKTAGRWQAQLEASARLMEAQRSIRHVPATPPTTADSPPKCSLLGTYEQMGPAGLDDSRCFWDKAKNDINVHGVRLRLRERFSAIALCKRFAAPTTLARELQLQPAELRFPDTATVAAAEWLIEAEIDPDRVRYEHRDWNGRWIHQKNRHDVEETEKSPPEKIWEQIRKAKKKTPPPSYYAILMMDADNMGQWLKGDFAPKVCEVLHPKMVSYYQNLGQQAQDGLNARRPVGPALHASISEALNNFASHVAPGIVEKHNGTMIYSGGDDVLALLPVRQAVSCADALSRAFRGEDGVVPGWTQADKRQYLAMGKRATLSAGIAFVHFMEDLRLALDAARQAEKAAKNDGRNRLTLHFMRRSGERSQASLTWDLAQWFQELVQIFADGATDGWTYRLREELPTLKGSHIPEAAVGTEIRRLVDRTDESASGASRLSGAKVKGWWENYLRPELQSDPLESFILLCQGASFVARGQDG